MLLPQASQIAEADAQLRPLLSSEKIRAIVSLIPDNWLEEWPGGETPDQVREVYYQFLTTRIAASAVFVNEAQHARETLI